MRKKQFLAAILLGVVLCFVSGVGYGKVNIPGWGTTVGDIIVGATNEKLWPYVEGTREDVRLLRLENALLNARIQYIMRNPTDFLSVDCYYDSDGRFSYPDNDFFPEGVDTKGKVLVFLTDNRGAFSLPGVALLDVFYVYLKIIYSYLNPVATNMDTDIVALFISQQAIPLGYFYQGEYHLWEEQE